MGKYISVFLAISLLAGCSDAPKTEKESDKGPAQETRGVKVIQDDADLQFPKGKGSVKLDFQKDAINFIVAAEELSPDWAYSIKIVNGTGGVTFGPEENVDISAGEVAGATAFKPDRDGRLIVSMANPDRVVEGSRGVSIAIQGMDGDALMELIQTEQFRIKRK